MVERHEIEGHEPMQVIAKLQSYFEENCEEYKIIKGGTSTIKWMCRLLFIINF